LNVVGCVEKLIRFCDAGQCGYHDNRQVSCGKHGSFRPNPASLAGQRAMRAYLRGPVAMQPPRPLSNVSLNHSNLFSSSHSRTPHNPHITSCHTTHPSSHTQQHQEPHPSPRHRETSPTRRERSTLMR
jgi:hypothetical protein